MKLVTDTKKHFQSPRIWQCKAGCLCLCLLAVAYLTETQQESEEKEALGKKYRPVLHFAKCLLLVCLWLPSHWDILNKDFAEATIDHTFDPANEWQTWTPSNATQIQGVLADMAPYLGAKWDEIMTTEHFWTFVSPVLSAPGSLPSNIA